MYPYVELRLKIDLNQKIMVTGGIQIRFGRNATREIVRRQKPVGIHLALPLKQVLVV